VIELKKKKKKRGGWEGGERGGDRRGEKTATPGRFSFHPYRGLIARMKGEKKREKKRGKNSVGGRITPALLLLTNIKELGGEEKTREEREKKRTEFREIGRGARCGDTLLFTNSDVF